MHVALICCSESESTAVRSRLDEACSNEPELAIGSGNFDFFVVGSGPGREAAIDAARRAGAPHLLLLRSSADYATAGDDVAAIGPGVLEALPHIIRREVRARAERERAADSEDRYRELVDCIPGAVWTSLESGKVLFTSDGIEELTGFTPEEFRHGGMQLRATRVHPADIGALLERWTGLFAGDSGAFELDYRFLRKDGRWAWLHESVTLVHEPGREHFAVGISTDVTARRTAEQALRSSEVRYRTLVEQASDVIFSVDVDGRFTSLNGAFEQLTGWTCEEWIGRPFADVLDPSSVSAASQYFQETVAGQSLGYAEHQLRTKNGAPVTVEATAQRLVFDGQILGAVGIARDITRRKEAAAEVAQEKRFSSLGQLATAVAHEFNNVLMSILPFAELLQRRMPDDEHVSSATRNIIQAVHRGRKVSQDVLRFARPVAPQLERIAVADWLVEFCARSETLLGPRYAIEHRLAKAEADVFVAADRTLLDQVVTSLVVNSSEAMPRGGTIVLEAKRSPDAGYVEILVHDTGCGIPDKSLDHVFEPLFTTKRGRIGLGLSVAYQAMKQQDGSIHVRSDGSAGTTFTLCFRACDGTAR